MNKEMLLTKTKQFFHDAFVFPFYIIFHPIKGFDEFKTDKKGKMYIAIIYVLLMVLAVVMSITMAGFLITPPSAGTFNIFRTTLLVIVPVILAAVGNWSITTLFDGKGSLKEIFMVIGYGLIPYVWISIPATILSNFLVRNEIQFYYAIVSLASVFAGYKIFMGLLVIHEYGLLKTIITILITAVAAGVMIFIGVLLATIFQQVYGFIKALYDELVMRTR